MSDDLFEKKEAKPPRQPLSFSQTAFAVMLGVLIAQEIRGFLDGFFRGLLHL